MIDAFPKRRRMTGAPFAALAAAAASILGSCTAAGRERGPDAGPGPGIDSSIPDIGGDGFSSPLDWTPGGAGIYVSSWGRTVLSRVSLVAKGRVSKLFLLQAGITVASFEIEEILMGPESTGSVLVVTTDPAFFEKAENLVLFLERESEGGRFSVLDKIELGDPRGGMRLESVRKYLALENMDDTGSKLSNFKKMLFEFLDVDDRWHRMNAVREIHILTYRHPEAFDRDDAARLEREAKAGKKESVKNHFLYSLAHIEVLPDLRRIEKEGEDARESAGRLGAMFHETGISAERIRMREDVVFQEYRACPDARARAALIRAAAGFERPRLKAGVIKALRDPSFLVRIEAAGALRETASGGAAGPVAALLQDPFPQVRRQAALTLAVIGTEKELPALEKLASSDAEAAEVREAAEFAAGELRK